MIDVETFEINEVVDEVVSDADSLALIEKMGLDGQQALKSGDGMNLCPYQQINQEQSFIIATLCPQMYRVKEYSRGQIPLRVLQIISHVLDGEYFEEVYIYDKEDTTIKDPFLIGKRKDPNSTYNYDFFLLARWGEELESWKVLGEKAKEAMKDIHTLYIARMRGILDAMESRGKYDDYRGEYMENFSKPSLA